MCEPGEPRLSSKFGSLGRGQIRFSRSKLELFVDCASPNSLRYVSAFPVTGFSWSSLLPVTTLSVTLCLRRSGPPRRYTLLISRSNAGSPGCTSGSQIRLANCSFFESNLRSGVPPVAVYTVSRPLMRTR